MLHHALAHPNLLSVFISTEVAVFGFLQCLDYRNAPITQFAGVPIYTVYPWSLAIFGAFGALVSLKDSSGLSMAIGGAALFDLTSVAWAGKDPSPDLFLLWMLAISIPFLVQRKNIGYFLIHPAFLAYVVEVPLINYVIGSEAWAEIIWCACFYFAFYDNLLPIDPRKPMNALAHIT